MLALGRELGLLGRLVDGEDHLEVEVAWAARHELALSMDDVLARRMRLAHELPDRGAAVAPRVAAILGAELAWDTERQAREVERVPGGRPARVRRPVTPSIGRPRPVILAFDEGTTSARTIAVDHAGRVVAVAQREFEQRYPGPGDVRHDPEAIWEAQIATAREVIAAIGGAERVVAIGITNQRETAVVWDRVTGRRRRRRDRLAEPRHGAVLRDAPCGRSRGSRPGPDRAPDRRLLQRPEDPPDPARGSESPDSAPSGASSPQEPSSRS